MSRLGKRSPTAILVGVLLLATFACVALISSAEQRSFSFVSDDHPIDRWNQGEDRWAYFFNGRGTTATLAAQARAELGPRGFTEDASMRPWYRFVKGKEEVV